MRRMLPVLLSLVLLGALLVAPASAAPPDPASAGQRALLREYAEATWRSFVAMVDEDTSLPADNISWPQGERSGYTSPTNIGAYL